MAGVKDEGQWIIMMGFLVSLGIFFLAIVISQSTLVGQTTAEGVLEFPKNDIQDLRHDVLLVEKWERESCPGGFGSPTCDTAMGGINWDIKQIFLYRKNAIVNPSFGACSCEPSSCDGTRVIKIHYNNGVTTYDEDPLTINCKCC